MGPFSPAVYPTSDIAQLERMYRRNHELRVTFIVSLIEIARRALPHVQRQHWLALENSSINLFAGDLEEQLKSLQPQPRPAYKPGPEYLEQLITERDALLEQIAAVDRLKESTEMPAGIVDYVEAMGTAPVRNRLKYIESQIDELSKDVQLTQELMSSEPEKPATE